MKKKTRSKILVLCLIGILLVGVCLYGFLSGKIGSKRILNYQDIGLQDIVGAQPCDIYAADGGDPYLQGDIDDTQTVEELIAILQTGTYQRASGYLPGSSAPGSGAFSYVRFAANGKTYAISAMGDRVRITVDGQARYYYTNVLSQIRTSIDSIIEANFQTK